MISITVLFEYHWKSLETFTYFVIEILNIDDQKKSLMPAAVLFLQTVRCYISNQPPVSVFSNNPNVGLIFVGH